MALAEKSCHLDRKRERERERESERERCLAHTLTHVSRGVLCV
jgi:hypothetical protein